MIGFTGKERDSESGLDYFGARYYGSALGRFVSPDPHEIVQDDGKRLQKLISDPQNWNRYAYVLNNPLMLVDPDGREPNKAQAVTAQMIVAVVRTIEADKPKASPAEVLHKTALSFQAMNDDAPGAGRYVFTRKDGWIDAKHFFTAADEATRRGAASTKLLGIGLEIQQTLSGDPSGFSYEDLGSNSAGADFGTAVKANMPLSQQTGDFLQALSPTLPNQASNWSAIPANASTQRGRSSQSNITGVRLFLRETQQAWSNQRDSGVGDGNDLKCGGAFLG